jgi:putative ABC transport system permease protein
MRAMRQISFFFLVFRGIRYYRRSHLTVAAGACIAALVLTGALLVGDSLKASLRSLAAERLGITDRALMSQQGFFKASLAASLFKATGVLSAPLVQRAATVSADGGRRNENRSVVVGVDSLFWRMGPSKSFALSFAKGDAAVNEALARKLSLSEGDQIVVRFEQEDPLPLEAPFSGGERNRASLRLRVGRIIGAKDFGDFSLKAEHRPVYNVFVPLEVLAAACGKPGHANAALVGPTPLEGLLQALKQTWSPADAGIHIRRVNRDSLLEINADRVFLDTAIVGPIFKRIPQARPVFTYFVNKMTRGEQSTPYSFVSTPPAPINLAENEIALGRWVADDLGAKFGDTVTLDYYVPKELSGLREDRAKFIVAGIVPHNRPWSDSTLMPAFPGIADAGSCTEWNPGTPIHLDMIRPQDKQYWNLWRGTPKAFVSIDAARRIWSNRFGSCTAIRIPATDTMTEQSLDKILATVLDPAAQGLVFYPVRQIVESAVAKGTSFAPLFTGLSFFLIIAAVILTALLFGFTLQSRGKHYEFLIAAGFTRRQIAMLFLGEGMVAACIGAIAGAIMSPLYTAVILAGLSTIWHAAAQTPALSLHASRQSMTVGALSTFTIACFALWLSVQAYTARLFFRRPVPIRKFKATAPWFVAAVAAMAGAAILLATNGSPKGQNAAAVFFGVGSLLLVSFLMLWNGVLGRTITNAHKQKFSFWNLAFSNVARQKNRSVASAALFACALFVLGSISVFRLGNVTDPRNPAAGTGGFYWYAEVMAGIKGEKFHSAALNKNSAAEWGLTIVPLRLKPGDDASCFNINRVATPPLVGVPAGVFDSSGNFSFAAGLNPGIRKHAWTALLATMGNNTIPGIADQTVIEWGLGKSLGDTLHYVNERGEPLNIVLVAGLRSSIFQGNVLIDERRFVEHFPSIDGYRLFLAQSAPGKEDSVEAALQTAFLDNGLVLERAADRLMSFNQVENTYLSIFSVLGALGLLLGSAGIGIVVLRNAFERRHEIALLYSQGFLKETIRRLLCVEHLMIVAAGLVAGLGASMVAVVPVLVSSKPDFAIGALFATNAAVVIFSFSATWVAASIAVKIDTRQALSEE